MSERTKSLLGTFYFRLPSNTPHKQPSGKMEELQRGKVPSANDLTG